MTTQPIQSIKELSNNELLLNNREKVKYNLKLQNYNDYNDKTGYYEYYYFGDGFIIDRKNITTIDGIMMDHFLLTLYGNELKNVLNLADGHNDHFPQYLYQELEGKKITIVKNEDGSKSINADGKQVIKLRNSAIEELTMVTPKEIDGLLLHNNIHLKKLDLPETEKLGQSSLYYNEDLEEFNLPKGKFIGHDVLWCNNKLKSLILPNATSIVGLLNRNEVLEKVYAPKIKTLYMTSLPLDRNENLKEIFLPSIEEYYNIKDMNRFAPKIARYIKKTIKENLAKQQILNEQHSR